MYDKAQRKLGKGPICICRSASVLSLLQFITLSSFFCEIYSRLPAQKQHDPVSQVKYVVSDTKRTRRKKTVFANMELGRALKATESLLERPRLHFFFSLATLSFLCNFLSLCFISGLSLSDCNVEGIIAFAGMKKIGYHNV